MQDEFQQFVDSHISAPQSGNHMVVDMLRRVGGADTCQRDQPPFTPRQARPRPHLTEDEFTIRVVERGCDGRRITLMTSWYVR